MKVEEARYLADCANVMLPIYKIIEDRAKQGFYNATYHQPELHNVDVAPKIKADLINLGYTVKTVIKKQEVTFDINWGYQT